MVAIAPLTPRRRDEALAMAWIAVDAAADGRVTATIPAYFGKVPKAAGLRKKS
jgi:hypothetical protein